MNSQALSPADREAISQLRTLLKTEHRLNPADEEGLIASFLASRERQDGQMTIQRWQRPGLAEVMLQPGVVQAGVVGVNVATAVALWRAAEGNCLTCAVSFGGGKYQVGAFSASPQGALLLATVAFALLPLVLTGALLLWRPIQIGSRMRGAIATFIAGSLVVGAIETIAVGWGTYENGSTDHFIAANVVALIISLVVAAYSAITARMPPPTLIQIVYQGRQSMATKRLPGAHE